ncbi:MAG: cardiolipin synthase [Clostridia bacterium]|nr:cardiolipin synthase [Clostridia bacterium]
MKKFEVESVNKKENIQNIKQKLKKRPKRRKADMKRLIIAAVLFSLQIVFLVWALYRMNAFVLTSYVIFQLIGGAIVVKIVLNKQNPSYKIAWIALILLVPILGLVFFVMWGRGSYPKKIKKVLPEIAKMSVSLYKHSEETQKLLVEQFPNQERTMNYLRNAGFPIYKETAVSYYEVGDTFFPDLIEDMKKAKKFVFLEFYILSEGGLWQDIYEVLKQKVKEGVEVRVLYDDFGCITCLPKHFNKELRALGIQTASFNVIKPVVNNFYMNYRNHQKICVIDGNVGYTGGANIADEYINTVEAFGHWKDTGVRLAGQGVWSLTVNFLQMWEYSDYNKKSFTKKADFNKYMPDKSFGNAQSDLKGFVQPFADGPLRTPGENEAESVYLQMINTAKRYIYITTPYLVIDNEMIMALRLAAKSGVDVRLITPGVPDKGYVHLVTQSYYGILLSAGVKIYEYLPGFIHAKSVVVDDEAAVVGTINMDFRSFYLHFENGVWLCGNDAVCDVCNGFINTLDYCEEIDYNVWRKRPWYKKVAQGFLRLFAPLL